MRKAVVIAALAATVSGSVDDFNPQPFKAKPWRSISSGVVKPRPEFVDPDFDCKMRVLGWEFAQKQQPDRGNFIEVYDALQLGPLCNVTPNALGTKRATRTNVHPLPKGPVYFVDPVTGLDENPGELLRPVRSIAAAIQLARKFKGQPRTIALREGNHYLTETVQLSAEDSFLNIQNYNGERAVVSGGFPINEEWKPFKVSPPNPSWDIEQNQNAVYGAVADNKTVADLGKMNAWPDCQAACQKNAKCTAFTWHDANQGQYALHCYARYDGQWHLTPEDGHVSGHLTNNGQNIYVAQLPANIDDVPGLQIDGRRVTRARYPNCNPETDVPDHRISGSSASWAPPVQPVPQQVWNQSPQFMRNSSYSFITYRGGIGGVCDIYDPPFSYWCSTHTEGGGAFTFRVPTGVTPNKGVLPNTPYKNPAGAIVNTWRPARWANWMFEIAQYNNATNAMTFGKGGFQGARGENQGSDWFIENVFEELDAENEFYFDRKTKQLYLFFNGTGSPHGEIVATNLTTLLNFTGSKWNPVKTVSLKGITFTQSAITYMHPHGVPGGGDWALERIAAVFLQGTEGALIDSCNFTRLDGNGLMISGYNRGATVQHNEFSWIGDSAIASWGITNETGAHPEMGLDATDGNHPDGNQILFNLVHEVGLYEKQSSFYIQAKTARSLIKGNALFNGPRAGINFNDGFGGGDRITDNVIFNTCRESGDHGPFNSWDRQPFLTNVAHGTPSLDMLEREIDHNWFLANYESQEAVDNDDGSAYYNTHHNFMAYSGNGMKNDFGGHDNVHYSNIYAFTGKGFSICDQLPGHIDHFYNNTVIMTNSGNYGGWNCKINTASPVLHDNKIYTPDGQAQMCNLPLAQWVSQGHDQGTTVAKWPSNDQIVAWGKQTLWGQ